MSLQHWPWSLSAALGKESTGALLLLCFRFQVQLAPAVTIGTSYLTTRVALSLASVDTALVHAVTLLLAMPLLFCS